MENLLCNKLPVPLKNKDKNENVSELDKNQDMHEQGYVHEQERSVEGNENISRTCKSNTDS